MYSMSNVVKCPVCNSSVVVRSTIVRPIGMNHDIQMIVSDCGHLCGCIDNSYINYITHALDTLSKSVITEKHQ